MKKSFFDQKPIPWLTHLVFLTILSLFLPACYSTTAIKGTPVKELVVAGNKELVKKRTTGAEQAELDRMSKVKRNRVFLETDGSPEYRIGPLDVLEINSHMGDKITTTTVTVNHRGRISYSFIDDLKVAGMTPTQADEVLTREISSFIRNPRIDVLVKKFKSKSAMVLGEFASLRRANVGEAASGRIYLMGKTTLMDLIALAGGYTVNADIKDVQLIRRGKTYLINLYDIIEKGNEDLNVVIDDGDVVNIPELSEYGERVYVLGEVVHQGVYSLKDAQDLLAALALAGSITPLAKEENTLIVRGYEPGKKPLVMMADINALLRKADLAQNIRLKDGDLVYVPRMLIGDINDWIENTMPLLNLLLYPYEFSSRYFKRQYLHFDGSSGE